MYIGFVLLDHQSKKMSILITGGSGFIGQNFIKFLIRNKKNYKY